MPDTSKTTLAWRFFQDMKAEGRSFSESDLMEATGWKISTVRTYASKKWRGHLRERAGKWEVDGFHGFTEADFLRLMTQNAEYRNQN